MLIDDDSVRAGVQPPDYILDVRFGFIELVEDDVLTEIGPADLDEDAWVLPAGIVSIDPPVVLDVIDGRGVRMMWSSRENFEYTSSVAATKPPWSACCSLPIPRTSIKSLLVAGSEV